MRFLSLLVMLVFATGCSREPREPVPNIPVTIVHIQIVEDGEGPERESQSPISTLWDDYTIVQCEDGTRRTLKGVWGAVGDEFMLPSNRGYTP